MSLSDSKDLIRLGEAWTCSDVRPGEESAGERVGERVGERGGGGGIANWIDPDPTFPEGGGGAFEGALVLAADMGEHTMPPIPMLCSAARGDDLLLPNDPEVRRTCGETPREGDIEGDLPRPALLVPPRRRGDRNRAS